MVLWLFLPNAIRRQPGQSVSVYLMPFFGVLLAAVFLHETISLPMMIGGAITLGGTVLVVSTAGRDQKRATAIEQPEMTYAISKSADRGGRVLLHQDSLVPRRRLSWIPLFDWPSPASGLCPRSIPRGRLPPR